MEKFQKCVLGSINGRKTLIFFVVVLMCQWPRTSGNSASSNTVAPDIFVKALLEKYGTNENLSISQLEDFIRTLKGASGTASSAGHGSREKRDADPGQVTQDGGGAPCDSTDWLGEANCTLTRCLSAENIFQLHAVPNSSDANRTKLIEMSPTILYTVQNKECKSGAVDKKKRPAPTTAEVWGYSFLCVTFINLCAIIGIIFIPFMKHKFYQVLLMFMVALAVGTLAGSSLLFLIPDAFGLVTPEYEALFGNYCWIAMTVIGGIYLFFNVERILKIIINKHTAKKDKHAEDDLPVCSVRPNTLPDPEPSSHMSFSVPDRSGDKESGNHDTKVRLMGNGDSDVMYSNLSNASTPNGEAGDHAMIQNGVPPTIVQSQKKKEIAPVAWMIIFGDGIHNFIDGLSIGAAFTESTLVGLSISVAVICEELPHELGDFAVLLQSGLSMKQAMGYNFLSACMCYLGTAVGILLGEMTGASHWIFAVAGGMFLYISLVDMLPEVNKASEDEEHQHLGVFRIYLIQNAGMLTGFGIMLLMALYGGEIKF